MVPNGVNAAGTMGGGGARTGSRQATAMPPPIGRDLQMTNRNHARRSPLNSHSNPALCVMVPQGQGKPPLVKRGETRQEPVCRP